MNGMLLFENGSTCLTGGSSAGVTQQLSVPMRNMVDTIRNHYVQQQLR